MGWKGHIAAEPVLRLAETFSGPPAAPMARDPHIAPSESENGFQRHRRLR